MSLISKNVLFFACKEFLVILLFQKNSYFQEFTLFSRFFFFQLQNNVINSLYWTSLKSTPLKFLYSLHVMDDITDVQLRPLTKSKYLTPNCIHYKQVCLKALPWSSQNVAWMWVFGFRCWKLFSVSCLLLFPSSYFFHCWRTVSFSVSSPSQLKQVCKLALHFCFFNSTFSFL